MRKFICFLVGHCFPILAGSKTSKNIHSYSIRDLDPKNSINRLLLINKGGNLCDLRTVILRYIILKSSVYVNSHFITHTIYFQGSFYFKTAGGTFLLASFECLI